MSIILCSLLLSSIAGKVRRKGVALEIKDEIVETNRPSQNLSLKLGATDEDAIYAVRKLCESVSR